jgi:hypothetical protein
VLAVPPASLPFLHFDNDLSPLAAFLFPFKSIFEILAAGTAAPVMRITMANSLPCSQAF